MGDEGLTRMLNIGEPSGTDTCSVCVHANAVEWRSISRPTVQQHESGCCCGSARCCLLIAVVSCCGAIKAPEPVTGVCRAILAQVLVRQRHAGVEVMLVLYLAPGTMLLVTRTLLVL